MPKIKRKKEFAYYIQDFLDYCDYKGLSDKTKKSYYQTLSLFAKYLEEEKDITSISDVNKEIVEEYISFTKERGKYSYVADEKYLAKNYQHNRTDIGNEVSVATLNNYLRNIKVFFNWCEANSLIRYNTVSDVKPIKGKRKTKDQLTDEEYNKLIHAIDLTKFNEYRDYIVIHLLIDTGMRVSECLSLTEDDIDPVKKSIFLRAEVTKGKKDRYVFYSNKMSLLLNRWVRYKESFVESEFIFPTQRTNRMLTAPNFERHFKKYIKRAKINKNVTPHVLRNNFGRRFLLNGGDIFMLSKILGHSSVTITEKAYLDISVEDIRKNYQNFSPLENMKR